MSYIRQNRKLIPQMIIMIITVILLTTTSEAAGWTNKQSTAHEIAQLARTLNLPEDNPIIVEAKRLWNEDYNIDTETKAPLFAESDAVILAKIMYSEGRGIQSDTEKACLAWVVLNRFDAGYGNSISAVATAKAQFGYNSNTPVWDDLLQLSLDVLSRWEREKQGETDVGRVLPKDYLWYTGDGAHNNFRNSYKGGTRWDYSLNSPYES